MVCRLVPLLVGGVFAFQTAAAQQAPRPERPALVVNMVVGGLPYDFVTRYGHNLSEGGFRRLAESGVSFTSARYDYMPTDRASSLATITTGTYPSVHGVVGERWCDVLTGEEVELIADSEAAGFDCEYGQGCYSNVNLIAPRWATGCGPRVRRAKWSALRPTPFRLSSWRGWAPRPIG